MDVETFLLAPGATIPNNPLLPVVAYRKVFPNIDCSDQFAAAFRAHGWQGLWRNGIFSYHHYHSRAHEVLGIGRGSAKVMLGGEDGRTISVRAGDCLLLPAGTGHCLLSASRDLEVIGAYPPGQIADMQAVGADDEMKAAIRSCKVPDRDPVDDAANTLSRLWRGS